MSAYHRLTAARRWTEDEKAYVYARYEAGDGDGMIGDALGRGIASIASFRRQHGLVATTSRTLAWREAIAREWGKRYPDEIGALLGITAERVSQIARMMALGEHGLPPRSANGHTNAAPSRPRGWSVEQTQWAAANRGDRQADLIVSMQLGALVGQGYGPRAAAAPASGPATGRAGLGTVRGASGTARASAVAPSCATRARA